MRWGKFLLLFQAVVTLLIGIAFFSQLTVIGAADISDIKEELLSGKDVTIEPSQAMDNIRQRFTVAAYMLFVIGLAEVAIIIRLVS